MSDIKYEEMPEGWEVLDISKDNKSCYVFAGGHYYGLPIRMHNGKMYFSIFDRCIWYRIPKEV